MAKPLRLKADGTRLPVVRSPPLIHSHNLIVAASWRREHERTMALAEVALGQIRSLRQTAVPRNYEIWYVYATIPAS
jgi:hypothetical protein